MRLRFVAVSPSPGLGARLSANLDSDFAVLAFRDESSRESFAEAVFAALGGPLPSPRTSAENKKSGAILGIVRARGGRTHSEPHLDFASAYLDYELADGRVLGVLTDLTSGRTRITDLDTNRHIDVDSASAPAGLPFETFESLVRVKTPDAKAASISADRAFKALKKATLSAGIANALADLGDRARDALGIDRTREWSPPIPSVGPVTRLRALEIETDQAARSERSRDHELQVLHAALRRKEQALEQLYEERSRHEYLLLRVRHKRISQKVGRIDDLILQLERLRCEPAPKAAESAARLAPRVEKLMAALADAKAELSVLIKEIPSSRQDVEELENEFFKIQEELSLLEGAPPVGSEIEDSIRKVYDEWRRLSAEADAAKFAAEQARADADELAAEPSESVARLSRVTTAEALRSRLHTRTAVGLSRDATRRKRQDAMAKVQAELSERGLTLQEAISSKRYLRIPIDRLAAIEEAVQARKEAEKTVDLIPRYRVMKRRAAKKMLASATAKEKWLLAEEGVASYEDLMANVSKACEASRILEPLTSTTFDLAEVSARLVSVEEELAKHAEGLPASDLSLLVDELEDHQARVAAALEIQKEADVAAEAARSLLAARDAAAAELLARLRPLGIVDTDPAMAWSRFRVLAEGWRKKKTLEKRLGEITSRLAPYVELREKLDECKARQDDLARRLAAVLSQIEGCDQGSLDERIAAFATLRDAALLEKKLATARAHLESQLAEVCKGKTPEQWRKELVEIEIRLSELEEKHPAWKQIEVASPESVLEEKVSMCEMRIRSAESSASTLRTQIQRLSSELRAESDADYHSKLVEIRSRLSKLQQLGRRFASLRLDQDLLYLEDSTIERQSLGLAAVGGRRQAVGVAHVIADSSSPITAYLLGRSALVFGCGPESEQLPLVIDGALDECAPHEKKEIIEDLELCSAGTQVLVLTSDPDIKALAQSSKASVIEIDGD